MLVWPLSLDELLEPTKPRHDSRQDAAVYRGSRSSSGKPAQGVPGLLLGRETNRMSRQGRPLASPDSSWRHYSVLKSGTVSSYSLHCAAAIAVLSTPTWLQCVPGGKVRVLDRSSPLRIAHDSRKCSSGATPGSYVLPSTHQQCVVLLAFATGIRAGKKVL